VPKLFSSKSSDKSGINPANKKEVKVTKKTEKNALKSAVEDQKKSLKKTSKEQNQKRKRPIRKKHIIYGSLIAVGAFFIAAALRVILGGFAEDAEARTEYEQLREQFPALSAPVEEAPPAPVEEAEEEEEEEDDELDLRSLSLDELAALNRDFIGWLTVGSNIDYPVVRGSDNEKYINTTFLGARNTAGAIFMDYRNTKNFDEQISTIYGHATRDGSMFSPLVSYLNEGFLQRNPNITVTTRDGRTMRYRIFHAQLTDAWDPAYTIALTDPSKAAETFPNAPANTSRFMLLSTCTRRGSDDERIIVFAALTG